MEVDALDTVTPREKLALREDNFSLLSVAATRRAYVDFQEHRRRDVVKLNLLCFPLVPCGDRQKLAQAGDYGNIPN